MIEKVSRQSTGQAALYAAKTKMKTAGSPDESTTEHEIVTELEARIDSLEKTVALQPDHTQAWADLAFCKLEHFGLTRRITGETVGLTEIRQTVEQTQFRIDRGSHHMDSKDYWRWFSGSHTSHECRVASRNR